MEIITFVQIPQGDFEHPVASSRVFTWNDGDDVDFENDGLNGRIKENSTSFSDVYIL